MKQHVERMNDWLLRAEATMALDDDVDGTYEEVKTQAHNHEVSSNYVPLLGQLFTLYHIGFFGAVAKTMCRVGL